MSTTYAATTWTPDYNEEWGNVEIGMHPLVKALTAVGLFLVVTLPVLWIFGVI